jgi:hypothetical protein
MSGLFHEKVSFSYIERVFDVFLGSTCCAGATHDVAVMQEAVENRRSPRIVSNKFTNAMRFERLSDVSH